MFMEERLDEILNILKVEGKVLVKDLSEKFGVTEGMIRKDLQKLEKQGKIKRTYGGAMLERKISHVENVAPRLIENLYGKRKIAELAVNEIEEDDVIFLDTSSTNFIIAETLSSTNKSVTVITNMHKIAMAFDTNPKINVICIGGTYNKKLGGTIGAAANEDIRTYRTDKAFIGVAGVNVVNNIISNCNIEEAKTKYEIMRCSKKNYAVMENSKFYIDSSYKFGTLDDIDVIITDKELEESISEVLINKEITVIV